MLRSLVAELDKTARDSVLPAYDSYLLHDSESWFIRMRARAAELVKVVSGMASNILRLDAQRHTEKFLTTAKKALSIDLGAVVRSEDLTDVLQDYSERNAALIKSLADEYIGKVQEMTFASKLAGVSHSEFSQKLQSITGASKSRADLIAYDQLSKLNAQLNETRQTQAGIGEYDWWTSQDERVRPRHQPLHGRRYKWGEKTGAEQGLPPGQPIRCRCVAIGVVEF